jgi:serine/threonine-protein kinase RsbW
MSDLASQPPHQFCSSLPVHLTAIEAALEELQGWMSAAGVPMGVVTRMGLALDELLTNIITHGYNQSTSDTISIEAQIEANRLQVVLTDFGIAFDPLQADPPDLSLSLEEREIGGLGIHFARQVVDGMRYLRLSKPNGKDANQLTLTKTI